MPRFLKVLKIFLLGLIISQILATPLVYKSNINHLRLLETIDDAGYLAIPNNHVIPKLKRFSSAFYGGIFFTLTGGACLTIISLFMAQIWGTLFSGKKSFLILFSLPLIPCLYLANLKGVSPLITIYLLVIPPCVFLATHLWLPPQNEGQPFVKIITGIFSLAIIALFLIFFKPAKFNIERFVDFRDHFLLSNSVGKKINVFYYDNSLYSAQVFKSIGQQVLRTCKITNIKNKSLYTQISSRLLLKDYLPIEGDVTPNLLVNKSGNHLELIHNSQVILKIPVNKFVKNPYTYLRQFEQKTDQHQFFRAFTMISMLFVMAVIVYILLFFLFHFLFSLFLKPVFATLLSGVICTFAGLLVILSMQVSETKELDDPKNLAQALSSDILRNRILALKYIQRKTIDISKFPSYRESVKSTYIPERYWLAKALGKSKTPATRTALLKLLDDPHFNVVCMALNSLGQRKTRADVRPILNKIKTSDNWYIQWYGYRALRRLGWKQKKSG